MSSQRRGYASFESVHRRRIRHAADRRVLADAGPRNQRGRRRIRRSRRTTASGTVVGFVGEYGSHVWLGIPYAAPPVGALRWRAPQPPQPWTGTREALAFGSPCTQYASPFGGVNRRATARRSAARTVSTSTSTRRALPRPRCRRDAARLPVMVWIHGGGNTHRRSRLLQRRQPGGDDSTSSWSPLNYRLGPFGWFRHAALRGDGTDELDRSGNFGTLDLVRALQWVRDNIAAFGGDPNNVTIFGESAGGTNVFTLLLSPQAQRPVPSRHRRERRPADERRQPRRRTSPTTRAGHANSSNEVLLRLLIADGTAADRAAAKAHLAPMSNAEIARYLRGKSASRHPRRLHADARHRHDRHAARSSATASCCRPTIRCSASRAPTATTACR